jgi:Zn-dependent protease
LWHLVVPFLSVLGLSTVARYAGPILFQFAWINLALLFFNFVPIAPLDGFFVLKGLLPYEMAYQLEGLQRYSMFVFLAVFFIAPLAGVPILDWFIFGPASQLTGLLFGV